MRGVEDQLRFPIPPRHLVPGALPDPEGPWSCPESLLKSSGVFVRNSCADDDEAHLGKGFGQSTESLNGDQGVLDRADAAGNDDQPMFRRQAELSPLR